MLAKHTVMTSSATYFPETQLRQVEDEDYQAAQSNEYASTMYNSKKLSLRPSKARQQIVQTTDRDGKSVEQSSVIVSPQNLLMPTLTAKVVTSVVVGKKSKLDTKSNASSKFAGSKNVRKANATKSTIAVSKKFKGMTEKIDTIQTLQMTTPIKVGINPDEERVNSERLTLSNHNTTQRTARKLAYEVIEVPSGVLEVQDGTNITSSHQVRTQIAAALGPDADDNNQVSAESSFNQLQRQQIRSMHSQDRKSSHDRVTFHTIRSLGGQQSPGIGTTAIAPVMILDSNKVQRARADGQQTHVFQIVTASSGHRSQPVELLTARSSEDIISETQINSAQPSMEGGAIIIQESNETTDISPMKANIQQTENAPYNNLSQQNLAGISQIGENDQMLNIFVQRFNISQPKNKMIEQKVLSQMMMPQKKLNKMRRRTMTAKHEKSIIPPKQRNYAAKIKSAQTLKVASLRATAVMDGQISIDEQTRTDKFNNNWQLYNEIIGLHHRDGSDEQRQAGFGQMRAESCYLPMPDHNYTQGRKLGANTAVANPQLYKIIQPSKNHTRSSSCYASQEPIFGQSEEEKKRKMSINLQTVGQQMQNDFMRMANAQRQIINASERAQFVTQTMRESSADQENMQPNDQLDDSEGHVEIESQQQMQNSGAGHNRRTVRSGYGGRVMNATTETLQGVADPDALSDQLQSSRQQARVITPAFATKEKVPSRQQVKFNSGKYFNKAHNSAKSLNHSGQSSFAMNVMPHNHRGSCQMLSSHIDVINENNYASDHLSANSIQPQILKSKTTVVTTMEQLHESSVDLHSLYMKSKGREGEFKSELNTVNRPVEGLQSSTRRVSEKKTQEDDVTSDSVRVMSNQRHQSAGRQQKPAMVFDETKMIDTQSIQMDAINTQLVSSADERCGQAILRTITQGNHEKKKVPLAAKVEQVVDDAKESVVNPLRADFVRLAESSASSAVISKQFLRRKSSRRDKEQISLSKDLQHVMDVEHVFKLSEDFTPTIVKASQVFSILADDCVNTNPTPLLKPTLGVTDAALSGLTQPRQYHQGVSKFKLEELSNGVVTEELLREQNSNTRGGSTLKIHDSLLSSQQKKLPKVLQKLAVPMMLLDQQRQSSMSMSSSQMTDQVLTMQNAQFQSVSRNNTAQGTEKNQQLINTVVDGTVIQSSQNYVPKGRNASNHMMIDVRVSGSRVNLEHDQSDQALMAAAYSASKQDKAIHAASAEYNDGEQGINLSLSPFSTLQQNQVGCMSKQVRSQYFHGFTQQDQTTMHHEDNFSCFSNKKKSLQQLKRCIDQRKLTVHSTARAKQSQNRQLFNNDKIVNSELLAKQKVQQQYRKKRAKNKKVFQLKFNDLVTQQKDIGKGMAIQGKNYGTAQVDQFSNKLYQSRGKNSRTANRMGQRVNSMLNYNQISDNSQIQYQQHPMFMTVNNPGADQKKPTTASVGMNSRNKKRLGSAIVSLKNYGSQSIIVPLTMQNTASNWERNLRQTGSLKDSTQHHSSQPSLLGVPTQSQLQTQQSMNSIENNTQKNQLKGTRTYGRLVKNSTNRSRFGAAVKPSGIVDQNFVTSSQEVAITSTRYESAEKIYSGSFQHAESAVALVTPAFFSSFTKAKGSMPPCFALRPNIQNSATVQPDLMKGKMTQSEIFKSGEIDAGMEVTAFESTQNGLDSNSPGMHRTNSNTKVCGPMTLKSSMASFTESMTVPYRLNKCDILYSKPSNENLLISDCPENFQQLSHGKRILTKAKPSVFQTIIGNTIGGNNAILGTLENLHQITMTMEQDQ